MYHDITLQEEEQMATKNLYHVSRKEENSHLIIYTIQWRSQDFSLGGAKLKDKIESKINLNIINRC